MSKENNQLMNEYYGLSSPVILGSSLGNSNITYKKKWLWSRFLGRMAIAIGSAVGGPIGGAIGGAIAAWLSGQDWRVATVEVEGEVNSDEYPLTDAEEKYLLGWFENNFAVTINTLADLIDLQIVNNQINKTTTSVSTNIVNAANRVLKAVSVIRANNETLEKYKERIGATSGITFYRSFNFTYNKVRFSNMLLDALEKGVFDYMEKNALDYKLVLEQQTVSDITQIEQTTLDWQGKTVTANVKKYVLETIPTKPSQVEVVVTNTDPLDP
ncbi:MAG TPA: hypothetical protein DHV22_01400, partial [Xanthomarina gelatinilytica]|nr:hypothetical protein [Xanthomarina gelatinilytica]